MGVSPQPQNTKLILRTRRDNEGGDGELPEWDVLALMLRA